MGFDINRFQGEVDEELICTICSGVLEEPLQASVCEHAFCKSCIERWILLQPNCPIDRYPLTSKQLKPAPRVIRHLLASLRIECDNISHGCQMVLKLNTLFFHLIECKYDPKKPVLCNKGCGSLILKHKLKHHNCMHEVQSFFYAQIHKLEEIRRELAVQRLTLEEHKKNLQFFKDFIPAVRTSDPAMRAIADQLERNNVA